jgi:hypothetical protein
LSSVAPVNKEGCARSQATNDGALTTLH